MEQRGEGGHSHLLPIASGYESGGRAILLDTLHGEITVEVVRCGTCLPVDIKVFFDALKERYRVLELIPCPGREIEEADRVPKREELIGEEEVRAQSEKGGTDMDWQYVRQLYREYGWPDRFRREEAIKALQYFMAQDHERRDDWVNAFH